MESVIGEYSSYQAALCAHNLEGHVVALWANTRKMENLASWKLQMSTLRPTLFVVVPPVELRLPSFETAASGKNKMTGMDLLRPHQAMQGLSLSTKKKTIFCINVEQNGCVASRLCLFQTSRLRQNHTHFQRCWKNTEKHTDKHPHKSAKIW